MLDRSAEIPINDMILPDNILIHGRPYGTRWRGPATISSNFAVVPARSGAAGGKFFEPPENSPILHPGDICRLARIEFAIMQAHQNCPADLRMAPLFIIYWVMYFLDANKDAGEHGCFR